MGVEGIDGGDVHDGSEEVLAHVLTLAGVEDVVPELAAMPPRPGVSALVDGDAKLRRLPDEVEEEGFRGTHGMLRIEWDAARAHSGLTGTAPHPTLHATPGDVRASVQNIGVAWRNEPTFVGIEQGTRDGRKRSTRGRLGYTSGSSSTPSNGTNASVCYRCC